MIHDLSCPSGFTSLWMRARSIFGTYFSHTESACAGLFPPMVDKILVINVCTRALSSTCVHVHGESHVAHTHMCVWHTHMCVHTHVCTHTCVYTHTCARRESRSHGAQTRVAGAACCVIAHYRAGPLGLSVRLACVKHAGWCGC